MTPIPSSCIVHAAQLFPPPLGSNLDIKEWRLFFFTVLHVQVPN